jgi:hypothetical protein
MKDFDYKKYLKSNPLLKVDEIKGKYEDDPIGAKKSLIDDVEDKIGKLEAKKDKEGWEMDVLKNWKDKLVKYKEDLKKLESNKTTVSELKTRIKEIIKSTINEEFDFSGSDLDERTAREIDLMIDMGHELMTHQEGKFDFDELKRRLLELSNSSEYVAGYGSAFEEFIENNRDNDLPNQSSGSFLTALIDLDGLLYTMGYEDNKYTEEQYDAASEYYESRRRELF